MSPRNSKTGVKWLNYDGKYLVYRHPVYIEKNGRPLRFPVETKLDEAVALAREANTINDGLIADLQGREALLSNLIDIFQKTYLPTQKLAKGTRDNKGYRLKRLRKDLGHRVTKRLEVKDIADYLNENHFNDGYIKHRGMLVDLFTFGITQGLCGANPAQSTLAHSMIKNEPKQRVRLTEDGYKAIHEVAPQWLKNAMDLSLVTLQGRHEIASMKFIDAKNGSLKIVREKTKNKTDRAFISIKIEPELRALISRCRDNLSSPFMIHHEPRKNRLGCKEHWTQVLPKYLGDAFSKARNESGSYSHLDATQRPPFHEIRSLGADRYLKAGYSKEYVNLLLGHTKMATTDIYLDGHEQNWTEAKAEIGLIKTESP